MTDAIGSTPSKTCGNGSVSSPRRRSSFSRRAARRSSLTAPTLHADVDLRDLELALGTAGHRHLDDLAALVAQQRLANGRLVGELHVGRLGLGGADDRVLDRLSRLLVLDVDDRADPDEVGPQILRRDDLRRAELLLEPGDLRLEHRLLVLGVVVLRVLHDVAELACFLDALGDLAALLGRQVLELVLELVETFLGEDDVSGHYWGEPLRGERRASIAAGFGGPRRPEGGARTPAQRA